MTVSDMCIAVDGPGMGKPCIFPFKDDKGKEHHKCILDADRWHHQERDYCATDVNANNVTKVWGKCHPNCEREGKKKNTFFNNIMIKL